MSAVAVRELPSLSMLNEMYSYDGESGALIRRQTTPRWRAGSLVGTVLHQHHSSKKYRMTRVDGKLYYIHRLVWKMATGEEPTGQIDHINGDGLDNRLENLRLVSPIENQRNQRKRSTNTSGAVGVNHEDGRWVASITVNYKKITLGRYSSFEEALSARRQADQQYGFHKNHGLERPL